jgi:hypothetical protein
MIAERHHHPLTISREPGEANVRAIVLCTLLAVSSARALPARAQESFDDFETVETVLTGAAPIAESQLRAKCMEFGTGWMRGFAPAERPRADVSCRMTESKELRGAGGVRFRAVRYTRRWRLRAPDTQRPSDRMVVNEEAVVLFSQAAEGGRLHPQWATSYGTSYIARVELETAPAPGGGALLSVLVCVNGTGGCTQEFMIRRAGRWGPVREPWVRQLPASLPGSLNKSTFIDPATLRGSGGLYAQRDPNCCPSRELNFRVALRGDSLVLLDHRVGPVDR